MTHRLLFLFCFFSVLDPVGAQWNQQGADMVSTLEEASSGSAVDLNEDGTVAAVGSRDSWSNGVTSVGDAQAYHWTGEAWEPRGEGILGENEYAWCGTSVALNAAGDVMAVGSTGVPNANGVLVGNVRVYEWDGVMWNLRGAPLMGLENPFNYSTFYGYSVDLSADGASVAVGGPFRWTVDESLQHVGYVEVYDWTGEAWILRGEGIYGSEEHNMNLGFDVALSSDGETLVTGAPSFGPGWQENPKGLVRVYAWEDGVWTPKGQEFLGALPGDDAGRSVSIANGGNTIAFSAPLSDYGVPGNFEGEVMVYDWESDAWAQRGETLSSLEFHDNFGESISLSSDGTRLAVGAPFTDNEVDLFVNAGLGTVYEWQGQEWVQICDPIYGDDHMAFAHEVAMSGDGSTFILGSFGFETSGRARVFRDAEWVNSVSEPNLQSASVKCFPNPSTGSLTLSGFEGLVGLELRTATGQITSTWEECQAPFTLDLSNFATGIYTVHGVTDTFQFTQKVLLQY